MATRTYCDNCGNTVRSPHKYAFGTYYQVSQGGGHGHVGTVVMMPVNSCGGGGGVMGGGVGGSGGGGYYPVVQQQPTSADELVVIDLCDRCRPIWMNRVKALTESSEPDA